MRFLIALLLLIFTGQLFADHNSPPEKMLIVGSETDFPPFALGATEQTASGFTVELWKAVAIESHINYTLRVEPFNQLLEEFKNGQIDVLINLAQSADRHRFADFSVPTAIVNGAIFVRKGENAIQSEADLADKSLIVVNADLAQDYAIAKGWQKQLVLVQNAEQGLKLLDEGKHDAMLLSKLVGLHTIAQLKLAHVKALMVSVGLVQKFSFAVHTGDSDLLASINEGLALNKASGVYDRLYDKWFGVYEQNQIAERLLLNFMGPFFLVLAVFLGFLYLKWRTVKKDSRLQSAAFQNRMQLALEGGDLGLWDWEIPSGKFFVNERWKEMLGIPPDAIISHISHWETRVHPNDWQYMNPVLEGYLDGTIKTFDSEYRLLHEDGRWIWVVDRGKVMERSADGKPLRMVGTHLDISDRKEKQFALETLLTEQNVMLENELVGMAKVRNSCFIWTSPSFDKIMGYGRNELIGLPTSHLFNSQEAYQAFSSDCTPVLNNRKPFRTQVIQVCKDGRQIWVDLSCDVLDPQQNEVMGVIIDVTEQKLAEDAKQEALTRLHFIAGQIPGFIYQFRLNPDGSSCLPYASQGLIGVCGVNPDEVREDSAKVFTLIHPDDYEGFINSIMVSATQLSPWQHEFRIKLADGTVSWLLGNSKPTKLNDNAVIWFGFIVDITDRRKMEAMLVQTEARYEKIINCSDLVSWDCDLKTGLIIHNNIWSQKFGYSPAEIQSMRDWENLIHPDDLPGVRAFMNDYLQSSFGILHMEYRLRTKSGQWLWLADRGSVIEYDSQGLPKRMAGTRVDITTRKLAEHELKLNQERLFFALQGANDGLWEWNYETDAVYFSPRWKSMLGYADNELVNELDTWANLVDPLQRDSVYQKVHNYMDGKFTKFEAEFRMRHKEGHWVDILSRAQLAVDNKGARLTPLRMIGTHVDISERKYLEQQRLTQEIEHRTTLIREVHHRIKNNIQGITGILRQFAQAYPETVNPINQAIGQMKSLSVVYGLQGFDSVSSVQLSELLSAIVTSNESIWLVSVSVALLPANVLCSLPENEVVPLALVMNELLLNAIKHGHSERVNVILNADLSQKAVKLIIKNRGQLPPDFDFNNRRRLNTGLDLVSSLLPNKGAKLSFEQQESHVVTLLEYHSPLINLNVQ